MNKVQHCVLTSAILRIAGIIYQQAISFLMVFGGWKLCIQNIYFLAVWWMHLACHPLRPQAKLHPSDRLIIDVHYSLFSIF